MDSNYFVKKSATNYGFDFSNVNICWLSSFSLIVDWMNLGLWTVSLQLPYSNSTNMSVKDCFCWAGKLKEHVLEPLLNLNLPSSACCVTSCLSSFPSSSARDVCSVTPSSTSSEERLVLFHKTQTLSDSWTKNRQKYKTHAGRKEEFGTLVCVCVVKPDLFSHLASVHLFWHGDTLRALCWHVFPTTTDIIPLGLCLCSKCLCVFAGKYFLFIVKSAQWISC